MKLTPSFLINQNHCSSPSPCEINPPASLLIVGLSGLVSVFLLCLCSPVLSNPLERPCLMLNLLRCTFCPLLLTLIHQLLSRVKHTEMRAETLAKFRQGEMEEKRECVCVRERDRKRDSSRNPEDTQQGCAVC